MDDIRPETRLFILNRAKGLAEELMERISSTTDALDQGDHRGVLGDLVLADIQLQHLRAIRTAPCDLRKPQRLPPDLTINQRKDICHESTESTQNPVRTRTGGIGLRPQAVGEEESRRSLSRPD